MLEGPDTGECVFVFHSFSSNEPVALVLGGPEGVRALC